MVFMRMCSKEVTCLLWSGNGRQLLSGAADGTLVVWDVMQGSPLLKHQLQSGEIKLIQRNHPNNGNNRKKEHLKSPGHDDLWHEELLVCFARTPANIIGPLAGLLPPTDGHSKGNAKSIEVPCMAIAAGQGRGGSIVTGTEAAEMGHVATFCPHNNNSGGGGGYIVGAGRGMLCLLHVSDLAVVDAVKLEDSPTVTGLEFDVSGRNLLVSTASKVARIFKVSLPSGGYGVGGDGGAGENVASIEGMTKLMTTQQVVHSCSRDSFDVPQGTWYPCRPREVLHSLHIVSNSFIHSFIYLNVVQNKKGDFSLVFTGSNRTKECGHLQVTRRFVSPVERRNWGASCFTPDGKHVVTALDSPTEHIIYTWNVEHGYPENTLQAGKDSIAALAWHPLSIPMQLFALGNSGRIYIWAKIMTQKWSAFAPDFETIEDNRMYEEKETEFDVGVVHNGRGVKRAHPGAGIAVQSAVQGDDGDGIIENEPILDILGAEKGDVVGDGDLGGPLLLLPVILPEVGGVDGESGSIGAGGKLL